MKLKYKNFEFPSNPEKIEILSSTNCSSSAVLDKNSAVQNVSVNPVIVKGSGEFYGNTGEETAALIQNMLRDKRSGWLMLPFFVPVKAFFTAFEFCKNSSKNAVSYSFEFTEDCSGRVAERDFKYTLAKAGENAFEIANRYDISVNDIMLFNDFKTPFDIKEGDRVVLR